MVDDIERRRDHHAPAEVIDPAIGQKDQDQPDVFHRQGPAFAEMAHGAAHQRGKEHIGDKVDEVEHGDLMHLKAEAFDHHEAREDHEDLPPRAGHELQRIIEPVAAAQHHFLVLHRGRLELRIGQHGGECDGDGNAPADHIDDAVAEAQRLPQRHDREIGHQRGQ